MKIHILGICGTFMGSLAIIAKELGHQVTGADQNIYPPMSLILENHEIHIFNGYSISDIPNDVDLIIIGNALSRGNIVIEYILNEKIPFTSGPAWLSQYVLSNKFVIAVAGTHGKTTTTSIITWVLEQAGLNPSYLIGGAPQNFPSSSRITDSRYFVIEADEYDTAFFDKRSKFIHYQPSILVINNLEYDHADIFPDLESIKKQFHHLIRLIPSSGHIFYNLDSEAITATLKNGVWSTLHPISLSTDKNAEWSVTASQADCSQFKILKKDKTVTNVTSSLVGEHNMANMLFAFAVSHSLGIPADTIKKALQQFKGVKRRLEKLETINDITIYDDFAHHPTAIEKTLTAISNAHPSSRIWLLFEPRSNTMKLGHHNTALSNIFKNIYQVLIYTADDIQNNNMKELSHRTSNCQCFTSIDDILNTVCLKSQRSDIIVIMSNGGFENIQKKLIAKLKNHYI